MNPSEVTEAVLLLLHEDAAEFVVLQVGPLEAVRLPGAEYITVHVIAAPGASVTITLRLLSVEQPSGITLSAQDAAFVPQEKLVPSPDINELYSGLRNPP
jgi:hypothetical protein